MQSQLLSGFVLMISGAFLAYIGLPDKQGRSPLFLARSGLLLIYPAVILALFAVGTAQIVFTILAE